MTTARTLPGATTLSVLDLVPVREDQSTADSLAASLSLATLADTLGYRRYWVAEHHNMPASAATDPPVLIAMLAGATRRIRVGSGGLLLPNHMPLNVAEQFALLEAAFPGRIDLGIGRSAGADAITAHALRPNRNDSPANFPHHLDNIRAMMSPTGIEVRGSGRPQSLRASPAPTSVPQLWLLGSSTGSARMAGERGLPYVFGHHFGGGGTAQALTEYRSAFTPSPDMPAPQTVLPVHAAVADTYDEAYRAALPWLLVMLGLATGRPQANVSTIEKAERVQLSSADRGIVDAMAEQWVIGSRDQARAAIVELAATYGVDEVMVHPVAGAHEGIDPTTAPGRELTLRLLAD
jgi:luciferase family oxidoreductase group 1